LSAVVSSPVGRSRQGSVTVSAQRTGRVPGRRSRENPAGIPRTGRTAPNGGGRHTASDQRLCVHGRPPESAEKALWTAEKREVIGSTPIPATGNGAGQRHETAGLRRVRRSDPAPIPPQSRRTPPPFRRSSAAISGQVHAGLWSSGPGPGGRACPIPVATGRRPSSN